MKLSVLIATFAICSSSFAATFANGIQLSGLPTASKQYSESLETYGRDVVAEMKKQCLADKAAAEAFVVKTGSKIVLSSGCEVKTYPEIADQSYRAAYAETSFEVVFK